MTIQKFIQLHGKASINGPSYRGAPQPSFDETCINESAFLDKLRFKNVRFDLNEDRISIDWESQEWDDNYDTFRDEIKRCYTYLAKQYDLEGELIIDVFLYDRDGEGNQRFSITITGR